MCVHTNNFLLQTKPICACNYCYKLNDMSQRPPLFFSFFAKNSGEQIKLALPCTGGAPGLANLRALDTKFAYLLPRLFLESCKYAPSN